MRAGNTGLGDNSTEEVVLLRRRVSELEDELTELRTSEAELRAMFRAMTDVVLVMNSEGRYLRIADTAPDLLYRPPASLVGQRMHDVMPAETAIFFLKNIRDALEKQGIVSMDYSLPIEDRNVWFSANISPMSSDTVMLVCRDVTERKNYEILLQDSLRQQETIRTQETTLTLLSAPLIPVSDEIVVMPLVGDLDDSRMSLMMETLLSGVQQLRAEVAILDVTGVFDFNAMAAEALIRAARAVQLLGTRVILTGIRANAAQALVELGVDLSGLTTRRTLQDAIRVAQAQPVSTHS